MKILALDSSTPQGSVALLENDRIISQLSLKTDTYSKPLMGLLDEVLACAETQLGDLDGFALTTGPGSFTGLRVGMSLMKGLILATEIPFVGVATLEAIAACTQPGSQPVCSVLDARKKEVYCARFKWENGFLSRLSEDSVLPPEALCQKIDEPTLFVGSGLKTYGGYFSTMLNKHYIPAPLQKDMTVAAGCGQIARLQFKQKKCFDLDSLGVNYVRKSEAETKFASAIN